VNTNIKGQFLDETGQREVYKTEIERALFKSVEDEHLETAQKIAETTYSTALSMFI
jgi:hypothetical protein